MQLVLDADGLNKLNRAGLLSKVLELHNCTIPTAVYYEAVMEAKRKGYEDAQEIDATLRRWNVAPVPDRSPPEPHGGLGAGETAILSLLNDFDDAIVVSDDRRFLAILAVASRPFLTPPSLLVVLARGGEISVPQAMNHLEHLRPAISAAAYGEAVADLERL